MTTRDYTANVISATKVVPDGNFKDSKASGVWDINEALDLIKGGNWPNAANINPAAFVDALFSCDVWDGSGSARSITNDIDLSTKEGLVWIKKRSGSAQHGLFDTVRGANKHIRSDGDSTEGDVTGYLTAFNSNGFSVGTDDIVNASSSEYVGWTFRSQPKFFDVVTYTGDGNYNDGNLYSKAIPHNLGVAPHVIIIKRLDSSSDWWVKHKDRTNYLTKLNSTDTESQDASPSGANYLPIFRNGSGVSDATHFYLNAGDHTNGLNNPGAVLSNINNATYVAYLFAHNNDDGGFGVTGDQDIIKCGSYTGNNSTTGPVIDLGFEPQWLLIRHTANDGNSWHIFDNIRGVATGDSDAFLAPNSAGDEQTTADKVEFNASGFQLKRADGDVNGNGTPYIYIAIRRGGMQTPTTASDVFAAVSQAGGYQVNRKATSGFPVDLTIGKETNTTGNWYVYDRLRGGKLDLRTNLANAEGTNSPAPVSFDFNDGIKTQLFNSSNTVIWYMWKRAKGYFDVVSYTGTGSARTVSHNLGVVPEMMWLKRRNGTGDWAVYHASQGNAKASKLNTTDAFGAEAYFNSTTPTSSVFSLADFNDSGQPYIAYLFATVAGVSKVGSYTGNSSSTQDIDCGFTNGAKMVILKQASHAESWEIYDTTRALVAGNDYRLRLDSTEAQATNSDFIDPLDSGFTAVADSNLNGRTYIFYAIANDPS